jgi:OOP family OmpA-OmpF porin
MRCGDAADVGLQVRLGRAIDAARFGVRLPSMRTLRGCGAIAAGLVLVSASNASAQVADPPFDPAIDVQLFNYAIGPKTFLTVSDAGLGARRQLSMDFLVTFLTKPFTIYNVSDDMGTITTERTQVVDQMLSGQIAGAYTLTDKLQLGASLPVVFTMSGEGLEPSTGMPAGSGLQITGLGDLLVEGKYGLMRGSAMRLAAALGVTAPTSFGSGGSTYIGDDLPSVRAHLDASWPLGRRLTVGATGGAIIRKTREIYSSEIGPQLTFGAAAALRVTDKVSLIGEGYGRTGFGSFAVDESPIEAVGGLRLQVGRSLSIVAGGGAGLTKGIGSPEARFFVGLGYAPDTRDTDGDGVPNSVDGCVLVPEDMDGYKDGDGCPDDDNDGDMWGDDEDKCPSDAEDKDGFEDDDGCPELDNDSDKIPDLEDRCIDDAEDGKAPNATDGCPNDKRDSDSDGVMDNMDACPEGEEDMDEFEDWDGCPEPDNDGDKVPDESDRCQLCAEDADGFMDDDGCAEFDNDADGVTDASDKCPDEAETINGVTDFDGCPDDGPELVRLDGDVLVVDRAPTFDKRGLTKSGASIIDQMALVMNRQADVTSWLVAVRAPKERDAMIQAEWIRTQLLSRKVNEEALQVQGAAGTAKVAAVVQARAEEGADLTTATCTPEFEVRPRLPPAGGAASVPAMVDPVAPTSEPEPEPVAAGEPAEPDTDADGLVDSVDRCPTEAGAATAEGCPGADGDGDGIVDAADNCPTEKGDAANRGCAAPQLVTIIGGKLDILESVNFKSGKATIEKSSYALLDNVAKVLASHPTMVVRVEGHTDSAGDDKKNKTLSQKRADAVVAYLKKKKIAKTRMTAKGFGEEQPIFPNDTPEGQAKNRRVVFAIVQP